MMEGGGDGGDDGINPGVAAKAFLADVFSLESEQGGQLRYHRETFYQHTGNRFIPISKDGIRAALLLNMQETYPKITTGDIKNVLMHVQALTQIDDVTPMPTG